MSGRETFEADVNPLEQGDEVVDFDLVHDLLASLDVEHTVVSDESGTTIAVAGGARGTFGWSGLTVTYNFDEDGKFIFIGMVRG